jgi:hypothetical protein
MGIGDTELNQESSFVVINCNPRLQSCMSNGYSKYLNYYNYRYSPATNPLIIYVPCPYLALIEQLVGMMHEA